MRKLFLLALVPLALAFANPAVAATPVKIMAGGFEPAQVTVGAGDEVTWTNNDNFSHNIFFENGTLPDANLHVVDYDANQHIMSFAGVLHTIPNVPELSTYVALLAGLLGVTVCSRRRLR